VSTLLAALRRLVLLVLGASALTVVVSVLVGLLTGSSLDRALTLGFYLVGCFLLVTAFFVGNRGPARVKSETAEGGGMFPYFGTRHMRWATLNEQDDAINNSAVFVILGFVLVFIGALIDSRHSLF
jgi:Na+/citrate or Na+/malate symporter